MEVQVRQLGIRFTCLTDIDGTKHDSPWLIKTDFWLGTSKVNSNNMLEVSIESDQSLLKFSKQALLGDQLKILEEVIKSLFWISDPAAYPDIGGLPFIF